MILSWFRGGGSGYAVGYAVAQPDFDGLKLLQIEKEVSDSDLKDFTSEIS